MNLKIQNSGSAPIVHLFQFRKNGKKHRDVAGHAPDHVGDRLREKNAVYAETEQARQKERQRYDHDNFAEQGEEDRLVPFPQRLEDCLAGELE